MPGLLGVCLLAIATQAGATGHPVPLALPTDSVPWTRDHESHQYRILESEMKTRMLTGFKSTGAEVRTMATANMDLYDARFYDLVLDLSPTTRRLTGIATIEAEVVGVSLSSLDLDLSWSMTVTAVRSGGVAVSSSRNSTILTVTLDRSYSTGEIVTVEVEYFGNPAGGSFGWETHLGKHLVWTLSEPYGARDWWPCKDLNTDKADSVALHVTVPENLVVASNGTLEQVTVPGAGLKTYHWTERYPIATYLVSVTAYPYTVFYDEYVSAQGDTVPLEYFVFPDQLAAATAGYADVPQMMSVFAELYGEYPYLGEKYGHAQFLWGGGMEHQTCSSMIYNRYPEYLISHELAHQWMGDLITCADFSHIWINEGFATWSEAYWLEKSVGAEAYRAAMNNTRFTGGGTVIVEDPNDFAGIFNYFLTYQRASWVPHMLRHVVGEADFLAGLQLLRTEFGYSGATTADVQGVFETTSGLDLTDFFQQWIYGEYFPIYRMSWTATGQGGGQDRVNLRIQQTQDNTGLFNMPLDVRVTTSLGDTTLVVQNSLAEQWYELVVNGDVLDVQLDPDSWVLRTVEDGGVSEVPAGLAAGLELRGITPNPFNPATMVSFYLGTQTEVRLDIHDVAGRLIKNLVAESLAAGDHQVRWNGTDTAGRAVASGIYFARLHGGDQQQVRSLTLVR